MKKEKVKKELKQLFIGFGLICFGFIVAPITALYIVPIIFGVLFVASAISLSHNKPQEEKEK